MKALSMAEAKEIVETSNKDKEVISFLKKFSKLEAKEAKELKKELESLNILKLKDMHIAKIIDLLPEDISDLNKIFVDVSLDEDEINKILELTKKYI